MKELFFSQKWREFEGNERNVEKCVLRGTEKVRRKAFASNLDNGKRYATGARVHQISKLEEVRRPTERLRHDNEIV